MFVFFYSNDTGFNALLVSFCAGAGSTRNPHFPKSPEEPKFFGHPLVDCGNTAEKSDLPKEWSAPLITLYDHLKYKFVISLEGTDVASNLKWVMSSNSVAVMPRPKYESWFMEGRLQPGVHYIEIKDDYSDLEDKIQYYSTHVEEAEAIIRNAHAFVEQFRDKEREELISILVLEKYFRHTKQ